MTSDPVTLKATIGWIEDPTGNLDLSIEGMVGDELRFAFHCRQCGGCLIEVDLPERGDAAETFCKACRAPFGRLTAIKHRIARMAKHAGHTTTADQVVTRPE